MNKLEIEFMTTFDCNLACKYCYIKQKKLYTSKEIVDLFFKKGIDFFLKEYSCNSYSISYFGGEPLLNWDIIKYSHEKYFKNDKRCKYELIVSNGLELNQEKIDYIKQENLGFSLSFDGLWQNENRPLKKNNKSSFDEYLKKEKLIKQLTSGCKVMISPQNISTLTENFVWFVEKWNFKTPDFSLVRDNIWSDDDVIKFEQEIKRLREKVEEYLDKGIIAYPGIFSLWILDTYFGKTKGKRPFGCFAGSHGIALSPDGIIYPCARFATNKKYPLYDLNTGKIYEDNIKFLKDEKIYNPQTYPTCQKCKLYRYCNAGCLYSELENGNWQEAKVIKNVCKLFHIVWKESMKLWIKYPEIFKNVIKRYF